MTAHHKPADRRVLDLKDPSLLVARAYVAGEWIDAPDGRSIPVTDPFDGALILDGARPRSRGRPPGHRQGPCGAEGLGQAHRQGAQPHPARLVRPDHRQRRRSGADPHHRAGQAAGRGQGRGDLERGLYRVVRGRGQAHRRRRHSRRDPDPAHRGAQAAGGRLRRHHALELSQWHDHPQGRPGAGRRLHHGAETRGPDPALGPGARRAGRAGRRAEGRVLGDTPAMPSRSARSSATTRRWPRSRSPARPGSGAG